MPPTEIQILALIALCDVAAPGQWVEVGAVAKRFGKSSKATGMLLSALVRRRPPLVKKVQGKQHRSVQYPAMYRPTREGRAWAWRNRDRVGHAS